MNKYLVKIAALNYLEKEFARKVAGRLSGNTPKINQVLGTTQGVLSPRLKGVLSNAEKTKVVDVMHNNATNIMGAGKLAPYEATKGARAGARLARFQNGR